MECGIASVLQLEPAERVGEERNSRVAVDVDISAVFQDLHYRTVSVNNNGSPGIYRKMVHDAARKDVARAAVVDRDAIRPAAADLKPAAFIDRGAVRRCAGMEGCGCIFQDEVLDRIRKEGHALVNSDIDISAVFKNTCCRSAVADIDQALAVDRGAGRRAAGEDGHSAAVIDRGAGRRAAEGDKELAIGIDRSAACRAV